MKKLLCLILTAFTFVFAELPQRHTTYPPIVLDEDFEIRGGGDQMQFEGDEFTITKYYQSPFALGTDFTISGYNASEIGVEMLQIPTVFGYDTWGFRFTSVNNWSGVSEVLVEATDGFDTRVDTFTVTVNEVADPPVVADGTGDLVYTENDSPINYSNDITITDIDNSTVYRVSVQITQNYNSNEDTLLFTDYPNINELYFDTNGLILLRGPATIAEFKNAIEGIRYYNSSDNPSSAVRTIELRIYDATDDEVFNSYTKTLTVTPVNDAVVNTVPPVISGTVADGSTLNVTNGTWTSDPDGTVIFSYQWQYADDASFTTGLANVGSNQNNYTVDAASEVKTIRCLVIAADNGSPLPANVDTVASNSVSSSNSSPTDIILSNSNIDENVSAGTFIGTLTSTDPNAGDSHTYSLVSGTGSTDNSDFSISNDSLYIRISPDYETDPSLYIRIRSTDDGPGSLFLEKRFIITINNLDEIPPAVTIISPATGTDVNGSETVTFTSSELTNPELSVDNTNWTSAVSGTTTLADITGFSSLAQGVFTLYLRDTDAASNVGTTSAGLIKDTVSPVVSITSPTAGSSINGSETITFTSSENVNPELSLDNTNWVSGVSGYNYYSRLNRF